MEDDKNYWKAMDKLTDTERGIIKLLRSDSDDAFILKMKQEVSRPQIVMQIIFGLCVHLQAFIYFCLIQNMKSLTIKRYEKDLLVFLGVLKKDSAFFSFRAQFIDLAVGGAAGAFSA